MNLILIRPEELDATGRVRLADARAKHIQKVLRAKPGKTLRIGRLDGPLGTGTVEGLFEDSVVLACEFEADVPPRPTIDLLLAMPRPKVLKRLWAQFAALGVGRIFITNAEKVERYYFDTHVLDPDLYNARLVEGLQQARDTRVPEVTIVRHLKPFLEDEIDSLFPMPGKRLLADPSGEQTLFQWLGNVDSVSPPQAQPLEKRWLIAIGPEGGWTPCELEMFKAHGFEVLGMGPRILRTDTACIALISVLAEAQRMGV